MKNKKIPLRKCVVTREQLPKQELIRVVRTPEKTVVVDVSGKLNGRGAYLQKNIDVIKKAKEHRILQRVLQVEIEDSVFEELEQLVNAGK